MTSAQNAGGVDALLPCPFCGSAAKLVGPEYRVTCTREGDCYGQTWRHGYTYREDAIARWNKRAAVSPDAATVDDAMKQKAAYIAILSDMRLTCNDEPKYHALDAAIAALQAARAPDGAGGKAVRWECRRPGSYEWNDCSREEYEARETACPHMRVEGTEFRALAVIEPSLSREGASVSNAVRIDWLEHAVTSRWIDRHGQDGDFWIRLGKAEELARALATPNPATLAETAESVDGLVDQANGEKSK